MTDNEILKALECCIKHKCTHCPAKALGCNAYVPMAFAIDLINRQKEIIEAAISAQETLQRYIAEKDAEIERLDAELERRYELELVQEMAGDEDG